MIVLGRRYSIDSSCLVDAYDAICLRLAPLTLEEGNRVGMEDVIKIMAIRQEFGLGSRSMTSSPLPTLEQLRCHFGLSDAMCSSMQTLEGDDENVMEVYKRIQCIEDAIACGQPFVCPSNLLPLPPCPTAPNMQPDSLPNDAYYGMVARPNEDVETALRCNSDMTGHEALDTAFHLNGNIMEQLAPDSRRLSTSAPADSDVIEDTGPAVGRPYWPTITRSEYVAQTKRLSAGAAHGVYGY